MKRLFSLSLKKSLIIATSTLALLISVNLSAKNTSKKFDLPKASLTDSKMYSPLYFTGGTGTITSTSNFTAFSSCLGVASTAQSFTFSASSLTSTNTVLVTAPVGYELSGTSTGTYATSVTISQTSSGTVSTTTLYLRLSASAAAGTYTGTLVLSSNGASSDVSIVLPSSTVNPNPTISGTLTTVIGGTATLTSNITGGTWSSSVTSVASIGTSSSTATVTGVANGTSTITYTTTAGCANTAVFTVSGPSITKTGTLSAFATCIGTASAAQTFTVTGSNLTSNINITVPTGYEIATSASGTYSSSVVLTATSGSVTNTAIYVRIAASATSAPSGTISITSTGATSQTVSIPSSAVNALPTIVKGSSSVLSGPVGTTAITGSASAAASGTWSSSNTSVATISGNGTVNGTVTGITPGITKITYTNSNGCSTSSLFRVVTSKVKWFVTNTAETTPNADLTFKTIGAAINQAISGDTIIVYEGTYNEKIDYNNKALIIASKYLLDNDTTHISRTIIDGNGIAQGNNWNDPIIIHSDFVSDTSLYKFIGFKVTRTQGLSALFYGGVIRNNIFYNNVTKNYDVGELRVVNTKVENNTFDSNKGNVSIYVSTWNGNNNHYWTYINNNKFSSQSLLSNDGNAGLIHVESQKVNIANNLFLNNKSPNLISVGGASQDVIYVINNTMVNNTSSSVNWPNYLFNARTWENGAGFTSIIMNNILVNSGSIRSRNDNSVDFNVSNNYSSSDLNSLPEGFNSNGYYYSKNNFLADNSLKFTDSARYDFSLDPTSFGIGYGLDTAIVSNKDYFNNTRPLPAGTKPDIGAIENAIGIPQPSISVTAGQKRNFLRWDLVKVPFVDSVLIYRSTDSLGTPTAYTKIGSKFNDTSISNKINGVTKSPFNPSDYTYLGAFGGSTYYLSKTTATWTNAKNAAADQGGQLVCIETPEENAFINTARQNINTSAFWAGGHQIDKGSEPKGSWYWVNGKPMTLDMSGTSFGVNFGEPNNSGGNEDFLQVYNGGGWNDLSEGSYMPYIIEYDGTVGSVKVENYIDSVNITNGTKYFYKVKTTDKINESTYSLIKSATPNTGAKLPTGLTVQTVSNIVKVKWTNPSGQVASKYVIYHSTDSFATNNAVVDTVANTVTSVLDSNLLVGKTYYYRIKAIDLSGVESEYTSPASVKVRARIYIDQNGNDDNFGGETSPLKTLGAAVAMAFSRDTIIFNNGTYPNAASTSIQKPLFITSKYLITKDTLDIKNTILTGGSDFILLNISNSDTVNIYGLTIQSHGNVTISTNNIPTNISYCIFKNNGASNNQNSFLNISYGTKLSNSTFESNYGYINLNNSNIVVDANKFINNKFGTYGPVALLQGWTGKFTVTNNLFVGNGVMNRNDWDGTATSIVNTGGWDDTAFIANNTFINNNAYAVLFSLNNNRKSVFVNNLISNPIGDLLFQKTQYSNTNVPGNTMIYGNTLTQDITSYNNYKSFFVKYDKNIVNSVSGMIDLNTYKVKPNYIGIAEGILNLKNTIGTVYYTAPIKDMFGNSRSGKMDIGAEQTTLAFAAPTIDNIEAGDNKNLIIIRQPFNAARIKSYKIYSSTQSIADSSTTSKLVATISDTLRYADTVVTNGSKYYYRVKAVDTLSTNPNISVFSNEISVTPNIPPSRIDSLIISSAPRTALLSWKKLSGSYKYVVLSGKDPSNMSVIANYLDSNAFKVENLIRNTNYYFAVKVVDTGGAVSKLSNIATLNITNSWYVDTLAKSVIMGSTEYPLISLQSAIDNAINGDTIIVKPGIYSSIRITNKNIVVKSEKGPSQTFLKDNDSKSYLVRVDGNTSGYTPYPTPVISGFNLSNFKTGNWTSWAGVVSVVENMSPVIENCVLQNNASYSVFSIDQSGPSIVNCIITDNITSVLNIGGGDSTQVKNKTVKFINSNILYNGNWGWGGGNNNAKVVFLNSIIWGNNRTNTLASSSGNYRVYNSIVDDRVYSLLPENIKKDPLFNDLSSGSYALSNASPGVGTGAPYLVMNADTIFAPTRDFVNAIRPNPAGSKVDIGAYENKNYFAAPTLLELNRDLINKNIVSISFKYDSTLTVAKYLLVRDTLPTSLDTIATYKELAKTTSIVLDTIANGKLYYYALKLVTNNNIASGISNIKNSNDTINVRAVTFLTDTASFKYTNASSQLRFNLANLSSDAVGNKNPHLIFYDGSYRQVDTSTARVDLYDSLFILNTAKGPGANSIKFSFNNKIKLASKNNYYQRMLPPFNIDFDDDFDIPIVRRANTDGEWDYKTEMIYMKGKVDANGTYSLAIDTTSKFYGKFSSSYSQVVPNVLPSDNLNTQERYFNYSSWSKNQPNIKDDADYIDGNFDGKQEYVNVAHQIKWVAKYTPTNYTSYSNVNMTLRLIKFIDVNNDGVKDVFATSSDNYQVGLNASGGSPLMLFVSNKKTGTYELYFTSLSLDWNTSLYIGALKNTNDGIYAIARSNGSSTYNSFKLNKDWTFSVPSTYKLKVNLSDARFDVADINADGFPDIVQFASSGVLQCYLNNQLDGFKNVVEFDNPFINDNLGNHWPDNFKLLDINNDGYKDIIWTENATQNNSYGSARVLRALVQGNIPASTSTLTVSTPSNVIASNDGYNVKLKWDKVLTNSVNNFNTYNIKIDTAKSYKTAKLNTFYNYRASNPKVPIILDEVKAGAFVDSLSFKDINLTSSRKYSITIQTINPDGVASEIKELEYIPTDVLSKSKDNFLPGLSNSRLEWGDYNNDGLLDLAVMGQKDDGTAFTAIYRNDNGKMTDLGLTNIGLINGDLKWADINNDGWLDLVVIGQFSATKNKNQVFINRKSFFEIVEDKNIPALKYSSMTFGDQDRNGTMDLVVIGADSVNNPKSYLLNNDGQGNFKTDNNFTNNIIPGICYGDVKFIDWDLDGDLDLLYSGSDRTDLKTAYGRGGIRMNTLLDAKNTVNYINNFQTVYLPNLNLSNSKFDIGDIDNDGDMDIVAIGSNQDNGPNSPSLPMVKLIKNLSVENRLSNNMYYYINTQEIVLDSVDQGSVKLSDFNNDGLLDLAYTGTNKLKSPTTKLLLNLGGFNNFDTVRNVAFPQYSSSTLAWGDYDNNGTSDLILAGENKGVSALDIFVNNQGTNINRPPSKPTGLSYTDFGLGRVMVSWKSPSDDKSPESSLYYLLKVGTKPGASDVMLVPANKIGDQYKLLTPNTPLISGNSYYLELLPGTYYYSVMAIDNNYASSDFSDEKSFTLSYPWRFVNQGGLIDKRIRAVDNAAFAWADFDNDGLSDFVYLGAEYANGSTYSSTGVYKNLKNNFIKATSASLELSGMRNIDVKCVDLNADGLIDIIAAGEQLDFAGTPVLAVYQNNGNFSFTNITNKFTSLIKPLKNPKIEFADFNNDGYKDLVFGGTTTDGSGTVNIYQISKDTNVKSVPNYSFVVSKMSNNLDQIITNNSPQNMQFAFADFNKDKTIDLVTIYEGASFTRFSEIYLNTYDSAAKSSVFTKYTGISLPRLKNGKLDVVDFNNDGLPDIALTGYASGIGEIFNVYQNGYDAKKGTLSFVNVSSSGLKPVQNSKTTWGDFNGDGYYDVIFSGDRDGEGYVTKMATSTKGTLGFTNFNELPVFPFGSYTNLTPTMGDINGDGQLGFVLVGTEKDPINQNTLYKSFRLLQNVRNYSAQVAASSVVPGLANSTIKAASTDGSSKSISSNAVSTYDLKGLVVKAFVTDSTNLNVGLEDAVYLANAAPIAPSSSTVNVFKKRDQSSYLVQFNWTPGKDDNTPVNGLTYNLSVGTAIDKSDIVSVESNLNTGVSKKPQDGNVGKDTSWRIVLAPGKYYYSVQSVDASYYGSTFSSRKAFTVGTTGIVAESTPPYDITFNDKVENNFYFAKGDSANFVIKMKALTKDTLNWVKLSLTNNATYTSSIFKFDSINNVLTLKSALVDTMYKFRMRAYDSANSEFIKDYKIYVRQPASKILLNNVDTSLIKYSPGIDSSMLVTSLTAIYPVSTDSSTYTYQLATGTGDANNASFYIINNTIINKRKLSSNDTLSVRIAATDKFGINTYKIVKFISTCTTKPNLVLQSAIAACYPSVINLTDTSYRKGSTGIVSIAYFMDINEQVVLKDSTKIASSGTYYIRATNVDNCTILKPIAVAINPLPAAPVVTALNNCTNSTPVQLSAKVSSTGNTLNWYGTSASGGVASKTAPTTSVSTVGTTSYYVSQVDTLTKCESGRSAIVVSTFALPTIPVITRDTTNYLIASTSSNAKWYKDNTLVDSSGVAKYKPSVPGSYTVKVTENGCTSASAAYYYLVTDIVNLSADEYIKLAPNPFVTYLNFDFVVKGYQKLNIEVFDVASGARVASRQNLFAGSRLSFSELSSGIYIFKVSSSDNKINYQFKMVKL